MTIPTQHKRQQTRTLKLRLSITNIGIIESNNINFNNIHVENAYITGVVNYGDYFTMRYSTFNNEKTFSIGFNGNDLQLQKVNNFLNVLKTELGNI
jgi:NRPS condensation-like uncharacterized protein